MREFIKSKKLYIIFFFAVMLIAALFPPSADDLGWATSQGAALLKRGFSNYNGRYLGNLLAVSLTRIGLWLAPIKAFVMTAILFYIQKLSSKKNDFSIILCAALLLVPTPLFIQGFVWTAGFTNYTVSALLLLVSADLILNGKNNALNSVLLLPLGVACQLFMETYTIFALVCGAAAIAYSAIKKSGIIKSISFFVGGVIGAVIMFSNGIYRKIAAGDDVYQKIPVNEGGLITKIINAVKSLFSTVSTSAIIACIPAIIITVVLSIMLMKKHKKFKTPFLAASGLMLASALCFPVIYLITKKPETAQISLGAVLLFYFAVCAISVAGIESKSKKIRLAVLLAMLLILCVPLSVVYPVGPRCFVGAYIILLLAICEMASEFDVENKKALKTATAALALIIVIDLVCYSVVALSNKNKINTIREQAQQGNKQIVIEHTKFSFFVYSIDTENYAPKYMQRFCEYYGLPEDIEIIYK